MKIAYAGLTADARAEISEERSVWLPEVSVDICAAEATLQYLLARWAQEKPDILLFPVEAHELAVRLSARLGCSCFPEVRDLRREGAALVGRKKVCSSNIDWEFVIEPPAILTLSGLKQTTPGQNAECPKPDLSAFPPWLLSRETLEPRQVNPLENARLVFIGGRGLGSAAACERLRVIAARYNAPLGFSRPAALNGWGKITGIIGQSGTKLQAEVCIALGVSGSAAFMAGIETSSRLIAVNIDKNAPIFRYADLGIIAPAEEFMTALEALTPSETGHGI